MGAAAALIPGIVGIAGGEYAGYKNRQKEAVDKADMGQFAKSLVESEQGPDPRLGGDVPNPMISANQLRARAAQRFPSYGEAIIKKDREMIGKAPEYDLYYNQLTQTRRNGLKGTPPLPNEIIIGQADALPKEVEAQKPLTDFAKLNADKNAGLITPQQFDQAVLALNPKNGSSENYRIMSASEAAQRGLPDGFTYQINDKTNQITKLTEPKQDKPTQGENTYSYHATRIASALNDIQGVLSKNKGAATTFVPGDNAVSKALRGDDSNIVQSALPELGDALLTLGTGAAYTQIQFDNQWKANLPAVGDSDAVLEKKFGRVEALYNRAKTNAGSQGIDLPKIDSIAALYKKDPKATLPTSTASVGGTSITATGQNGEKLKLVNGKWVPL